jgi:hypothetical protein
MKVKNVSKRLHHVGEVFIAPGEERDIPDIFSGSINTSELIEVKESMNKDAEEPTTKRAYNKTK